MSCAYFLPKAFPPTVIEATIALIKNCKLNSIPYLAVIFVVIIALIAPESTPQISPITSAQILATFAELRIRKIEDFEPFTFFVAFA